MMMRTSRQDRARLGVKLESAGCNIAYAGDIVQIQERAGSGARTAVTIVANNKILVS